MLCHYLISHCLQQLTRPLTILTSLQSLTSTPLCANFNNTAVNDFFANQSSRFWWLFLKGYVSGSLVAPSLSSLILNTLTPPPLC